MKNLLALLFLCASCFAFTACGSDNDDPIIPEPPKVVAGELKAYMDKHELWDKKEIVLAGEMNFADFVTLSENENITSLDLKNVKPIDLGTRNIFVQYPQDQKPTVLFPKLKSVVLPAKDYTMPEGTFAFFYGELETVVLPENTTEIPVAAFVSCKKLKTITGLESVIRINAQAFSGCESLDKITIPENTTIIGEVTFSDCKGLKTIAIPKNVTEIKDKAFENCNLQSIHFKNPTPPKLDTPGGIKAMFGNIENCTMYVPKGSLDAYKEFEKIYYTGQTIRFKNIVEEN